MGFINLCNEEKEVFFGIGVAPQYCSRGFGQEMTKIAAGISVKLFGNKPLYLEVRTWNQRAVQCYEKAGFYIDGKAFTQITDAGEGEFYRMYWKGKNL